MERVVLRKGALAPTESYTQRVVTAVYPNAFAAGYLRLRQLLHRPSTFFIESSAGTTKRFEKCWADPPSAIVASRRFFSESSGLCRQPVRKTKLTHFSQVHFNQGVQYNVKDNA